MAFINGIGMVSPQKTLEPGVFLEEVMAYNADYLTCIEPVYRNFIDPIQARRMSRLIKMGIAAAKISLADAGLAMPDAIITGTGLGSVEDTEKILGEITKEERFLNPTPFIQSTYNTISSQIAIQLKCHNYNSTYVHRTFSFESGLLDALLQIEEGTATNILAGGIDEMTLNHLQITRRIGLWKTVPVSNLDLLHLGTPGALAGEGAAFITLGKNAQRNAYARLSGVETFFSLNNSFDPGSKLHAFLDHHSLTPNQVDLVLLGNNGDINHDPIYNNFREKFFPGKTHACYKHLCGEYHTATGFGLYLASNLLKNQTFPDILKLNDIAPGKISNILIYNHFRNVNHAFMVVQAINQ